MIEIVAFRMELQHSMQCFILYKKVLVSENALFKTYFNINFIEFHQTACMKDKENAKVKALRPSSFPR